MSLADVESIAREAVRCRHCFDSSWVAPPLVDLAQPRWIGPEYWSWTPRILVLMLNPGSGAGRRDDADRRLLVALSKFGSGAGSFADVLQCQADDFQNWGRGRFFAFVVKGLELNLDRIALANIAWCATERDRYPPRMLKACYTQFTARLLRVLNPAVVLLSGAGTYPFESPIRQELPNVQFVKTFHFAHRRGKAAEDVEITRVRCELSRLGVRVD